MSNKIDDKSRLMIQLLLTDSKIAERVFENTKDKEKYKICTVESNGVVILGKTSCRWWNKLINCQDKLPFESFALKVWDALVDASSGINNDAIINGLSHEIILKSIREKEYDYVVNRLYDCWRHVAQNSEGYQRSTDLEGSFGKGQGDKMITIEKPVPRNIVLNIQGIEKTIPIVDSIGDSLNVAVEYGVKNVRRIYLNLMGSLILDRVANKYHTYLKKQLSTYFIEKLLEKHIQSNGVQITINHVVRDICYLEVCTSLD